MGVLPRRSRGLGEWQEGGAGGNLEGNPWALGKGSHGGFDFDLDFDVDLVLGNDARARAHTSRTVDAGIWVDGAWRLRGRCCYRPDALRCRVEIRSSALFMISAALATGCSGSIMFAAIMKALASDGCRAFSSASL